MTATSTSTPVPSGLGFTSATVRLIPSRAMDPLRVMFSASATGTQTRRRQSVESRCSPSTGSSEIKRPVPSMWPCTMWPPSGCAGRRGQLEIHQRVIGQSRESGARDGFFSQVGGEMRRRGSDGGQAHSVHSHAVAFAQTGYERLGRADGEAKRAAAMFASRDVAGLFDQSGEHRISLPRIRCRACRRDSLPQRPPRDRGGSR